MGGGVEPAGRGPSKVSLHPVERALFIWYHHTISFHHYLSLTSSLESQLNLQQVIGCLLSARCYAE